MNLQLELDDVKRRIEDKQREIGEAQDALIDAEEAQTKEKAAAKLARLIDQLSKLEYDKARVYDIIEKAQTTQPAQLQEPTISDSEAFKILKTVIVGYSRLILDVLFGRKPIPKSNYSPTQPRNSSMDSSELEGDMDIPLLESNRIDTSTRIGAYKRNLGLVEKESATTS